MHWLTAQEVDDRALNPKPWTLKTLNLETSELGRAAGLIVG